jgi:hypothetical protein
MEMGREVLLSTQHILKGLGENRMKDSDCFLWLLKMIIPPPVPAPVPSHSSSRASQSRKEKKEKKEYLKQMTEMAKIVQQQCLENKKLEKLFQIPKDRLSSCLKLSVSNKRTLLLTRGKKLSHQRSLGLITCSPEGEDLTVLGYMLT